MMQLSPRQVQILRVVIEEYIDTAQPVGSEMLDRKYNLGVSPATIRNEMVQLVRMGYLKQPHVSSGRIPTSQGLRFYVSQLMKEDSLSVAEEVSVKERMWDYREELDNLLREAVRALADKTHCVGLAITSQQKTYHSGYLHLLDAPEFYDIDVTKTVFALLDHSRNLEQLLDRAADDEPIHILLGDDFDDQHLEPVGIIFSDFIVGNLHGSIGIIGPSRVRYSYVIPLVRHLTLTLQDVAGNRF